MNNIRPVYDGGYVMVCNAPFAWRAEELRNGVMIGTEYRGNHVEVIIKFDQILDWEDCNNFLRNEQNRRNVFPKDTIRVLNLIMKDFCVRNGDIESGRFYFDKAGAKDLDRYDLLILRSGYFQSVRALEGGLTLNVDVMSTVFYKPNIFLAEAWERQVRYYLTDAQKRYFVSGGRQSEWNQEQVHIANEYWKNLQIVSTHRSYVEGHNFKPKGFHIYELQKTRADQTNLRNLSTNLPLGTLCDLLEERYKLSREQLEGIMPAIKVSKVKEHYLPWGCCKTTDGSRYAGKISDSSMLKKLERSPQTRGFDIENWMRTRIMSPPHLTEAEKLFNLTLSKEMMTLYALKLDRPHMKGKGNLGLLHWSVKHPPSFNFRPEQRFLVAANVCPWGLLMFDITDNTKRWQLLFLDVLKATAAEVGINLGDPEAKLEIDYDRQVLRHTSNQERQKKVINYITELFHRHDKPLKFVICIMKNKMTPEYATLKVVCDQQHGVPVQVLLAQSLNENIPKSTTQNRMRMLAQNVLLKINVKCGGQNFELLQSTVEHISLMRENNKTILLGGDVTHPRGMRSIAAVVATTNSKFVNYACRIKSQDSGVEIIQELKEMVKELLQVYSDNNANSWPEDIIFFRDGVSETAYLDVLRKEGVWILQAAEEVAPHNPKPRLTIILAVKRHHTRFFTYDKMNDSWSNISEGTVIDTKVTHPRDYDFFLCSQAPLKGTSRATHYYVLLDQINVSRHDLYKIIYYLCHTYQRCTKSVSLVTPVYYSHLAAFRAKHYMEHSIIENINRQNQCVLNAHINLRNHLWFL
ncbi:unnamed protein product [Calypogeia fissa]